MRAFVQTRGTARATDYAFLGAAPPEPWWRAYRDATAFDHPTVLVTADGERWAAYLSGIPSARVDAVGTVVRYTLVLDGPCGAPDGACAGSAVAAWLDDVAAGRTGREGGRLAAALDARFPPDDVQRWLAGQTDERHGRRPGSDESSVRHPDAAAVGTEVRRRALAALATLPAPPPVTDAPGDWIAGVAHAAARAAFVGRVATLVGGAAGRALLLNLVGGPDDAVALLDDASPVAVLVDSADPALARPTALRPVVEAKKVPVPPSAVATVAGVALAPVAAAVVLVVLAVTVLLLLL